MRLLELVKNQEAHFQYCRDKELWYKTDSGFLFPVPITDIGTGDFKRDEKDILLMRWIRRQMETLDNARTGSSVG